MPELTHTLKSKREYEYENKKFFAAIQGINIDEGQNKSHSSFEDIKARVFSNGAAKNADDILSLQGINAQQAGFGIGLGLDYVDGKSLEDPSW